MKAIVVKEFGAPDVKKLEEVPAPFPGPGQLLIRVHAVGVNPVEAYIRAGTYARKPNLPYIPGSDVGGTVEKVGPNVTALKPGDRGYTQGAPAGEPGRPRFPAGRLRRVRAATRLRRRPGPSAARARVVRTGCSSWCPVFDRVARALHSRPRPRRPNRAGAT